MKKSLTLILLLLLALSIKAQWSIGIKEGCNITSITRSQAGRIDEVYSNKTGNDVGVFAKYQFNDFFALRSDLSFMQRSHKMNRTLNYIDKVYSEYRNSYLTLPVMADFSFGGERLRGASPYRWLRRILGERKTERHIILDHRLHNILPRL